MSEAFLVHIDKAKREIAAADSLVKVKDLWNKADAMRALAFGANFPMLDSFGEVAHGTIETLSLELRAQN